MWKAFQTGARARCLQCLETSETIHKCCYVYNIKTACNWWVHNCYKITEHPAMPRPNDAWTGHHSVNRFVTETCNACEHTAQQAAIKNICVWLNILPLFKRTSSESWTSNSSTLQDVEQQNHRQPSKSWWRYVGLGACWMGCTVRPHLFHFRITNAPFVFQCAFKKTRTAHSNSYPYYWNPWSHVVVAFQVTVEKVLRWAPGHAIATFVLSLHVV